ncbi:hypothetical protein predicted by Glimmer/Critica [Sorangium cellulosum So ce56]|uniref:Uncharacterized protein n=1 Tax=Sorangium cellulosum (strain So ce56) TaxID=448385 RepID=A9G994_SORC5|nr:hypothetical protein predicted by Glimmer/Critica [Sorangium cellulosum So ce56]
MIIDMGIKGVAVQHQEDFHRRMADTLIAVDEWVALHEREAESCRLGDHGRIELLTSEGCLRLGHSSLDGAEVANACGATARRKNPLVEEEDLRQGQVAHAQASRLYRSAFFTRTTSAAARNSSSGVVSRSATAARASSSGCKPRLFARSWRRSACAGDRSMASFMGRSVPRATLARHPAYGWAGER